MRSKKMLKFNSEVGEGPEAECAFFLDGPVRMEFSINIPMAVSIEEYQALSKADFGDRQNQRMFSFEDSNGGQWIKLSKLQDDSVDVEFGVAHYCPSLNITLPFESCRQAFTEAASWRAQVVDGPSTVRINEVTMKFIPGGKTHFIQLSWRPDGHDMVSRTWGDLLISQTIDEQLQRMVNGETLDIVLPSPNGRFVVFRSIETNDDDGELEFLFIEHGTIENGKVQGGTAFVFKFEAAVPALLAIREHFKANQ